MNSTNFEIKKCALENDVKLYQIAERLGIHYVTLNTKLRKKLSKEEKNKILKTIQEIKEEKDEIIH